MKARDTVVVPADRETTFAMLCNPECYVTWVVGASRVRHVDADWPAAGSSFHHTLGHWPFELHDVTEMRRWEPPDVIELQAMARPFFAAQVQFRLEAVDDRRTRVTMTERLNGGLFMASASLGRPALSLRNRLALRRFASLVAQAQSG
jgi:carbon monoxide dehydrogenase subunit G